MYNRGRRCAYLGNRLQKARAISAPSSILDMKSVFYDMHHRKGLKWFIMQNKANCEKGTNALPMPAWSAVQRTERGKA